MNPISSCAFSWHTAFYLRYVGLCLGIATSINPSVSRHLPSSCNWIQSFAIVTSINPSVSRHRYTHRSLHSTRCHDIRQHGSQNGMQKGEKLCDRKKDTCSTHGLLAGPHRDAHGRAPDAVSRLGKHVGA